MSSKVKEYLEQIKNRRERKGERKPKEENILKRFNWNDKIFVANSNIDEWFLNRLSNQAK